MKRKLLIGSLLSLIFLYLAFRQSDFGEIYRHLRETRTVYLIPAVVLTLLHMFFRALRWRHLLAAVKVIPLSPLYRSTLIGFMANNLLPARLGELVRAHVIGRWENISRSAALATIAMERVFDLFTMLVLFGLIAVFLPLTPAVRQIGIAGLGFGVLILGFFIALHHTGPRAVQVVGRFLPGRIRARGMQIVASFQAGLAVLREGRQLLWAALYSFVMWALIVVVIHSCFAAAEVTAGGEPLPPAAGVVVLVVMAIGLMVPSGPGFVGSLQLAAKLGLKVFGVEDNTALSFSIVYHATQWLPITIVGLVFLIQANLSLKEIAQRSQKETTVVARETEPGDGESAGGFSARDRRRKEND
ncbi:MAG: flippase-like domain-containing protein [Candidatus Eisenbacteria bacterium]|nr:flippase-like domain-containing protein [Candidatus Eisenbacteria bacterium]